MHLIMEETHIWIIRNRLFVKYREKNDLHTYEIDKVYLRLYHWNKSKNIDAKGNLKILNILCIRLLEYEIISETTYLVLLFDSK